MKAFVALLLLLLLHWTAAHATQPTIRVNGERISQHLAALSEYGKNPQGGVSRVAYSEADRAGRQYVLGLMRDAGLNVRIDTAGNLVGERAGSDGKLRPIVIGSHIDSVPEGGNYDGDVGSLSAIELAQTLNEGRIRMRHPLQVIIFENEEGIMVGSTAIAGRVDIARLNLISQSGKTVRDGIKFIGGDPDRLAESTRQLGSIEAYIELHIEQGGVLEQEHLQIGVVEGIVGIQDTEVSVEGIANHAGTTPMMQRHDALLSAARFIDMLNKVVTGIPGRQVGTVGWVKAQPGAYNVVPGKVTLGMELRDLDSGKIQSMFEQIRKGADAIGLANGTTFHFDQHALSTPALTDTHLQAIIGESAKRLGLSAKRMPSGAGHDAQEMARLGPIGMIFVPSVGGLSHAPKEFSRPGDIENGANVLLESVLGVDKAAKRN